MRKVYYAIASILVLAFVVFFIINRNYKNSPEFNYITAKLDINRGKARIVHIGRKDSMPGIDAISKNYGFSNVYVEHNIPKQVVSGIKNYNEVVLAYLAIRNGKDWRKKYEWKIDSLHKNQAMLHDQQY